MARTRTAARAAGLLAIGSALLGATPGEADAQRTRAGAGAERMDTTFAFAPDGMLEIRLPLAGRAGAGVVVTGWSRSEARVVATVDDGELTLDGSRRSLDVGTRSAGGSARVRQLEVQVPAGTRVRINSGGGDIVVRGIRGGVDATTFNGSVTVEDAADRLELKTFNGDVTATNVSGRLDVNASNGSVTVRGARGDVAVSTLNGNVELVDVVSSAVRAKTMSGRIRYTGSVDPGGSYSFNAFSGGVDLAIPANTGATLSVSTFSGTIDSPDFPLTLQPGTRARESRGQSMTFTLGNGGARITLESFSGDIRIRERRASGGGN